MERNVQKALRYIGHAAESQARIVCFPQLFLLPWFLNGEDSEAARLASPVDHEIITRFQEAAKTHDVVLVCPWFESSHGRTFNAAVVINADGTVAGVSQKSHVPDIPGWKEKSYFEPGESGVCVIETKYARIGVQLCWDNFFPEVSRSLALKGAELVFAPTAAAYASQERWLHVISANAFVNNLYVFRVNRVGHDRGLDFYGQSFCVNPYGELIAGPVGMQESILLADVDPSMIARAREESGFFRDRRVVLYEDLLRNTVDTE